MKTMKRLLAVMLCLILALSAAGIAGVLPQASAATSKRYWFGSYPTTKVTNSTLLSTLNGKSLSWTAYSYGSNTSMKYADTTVNGTKYRGVKIETARNSYQDKNGYKTGNTYWFRYEPLEWVKLGNVSGNTLLYCATSIDCQPFSYAAYKKSSNNEYYTTTGYVYFANNYNQSNIKSWLNGSFYSTAFTSAEKNKIQSVTHTNNAPSSSYSQYNTTTTGDKVYLLSSDETQNTSYFPDKTNLMTRTGTDYAQSQGLYKVYGGWLLRDPGNGSNLNLVASYIDASSVSISGKSVTSLISGVRPVIQMSSSDFASIPAVEYTDQNSKVTITGFSGTASGTLVIPTKIQDMPVTTIGAWSFVDATGITGVSVPEGVTTIEDEAFCNCPITSVTLPDSLTTIGYNAFGGTNLTSINIPKNVTSIDVNPVSGCTGLTSITVDSANTKYKASGNCLIETGSKTLIAGCKNSTIPTDGSVTTIGGEAFTYQSGLKSITIPNSVTTIGNGAFESTGLTSLTIPGTVKTIENNAFSGCTGLTTLNMGDGVKTIGGWAFSGCTGLTNVLIPSTVTSIGQNAFYGVKNIMYGGTATGSPWGAQASGGFFDGKLIYKDSSKKELLACMPDVTGAVTLPNSVTSIAAGAFANCDKMTSITIPGSVNVIGNGTFSGCSGLREVVLGEGVKNISNFAFPLSDLTITIPDSVTTINEYAFGLSPKNITIRGYDGSAAQKAGISGTIFVSIGGTLTFDANGGSGAPAAIRASGRVAIPATKPTLSGHAFQGWADTSSATVAKYTTEYPNLSRNTTIYAVWKESTTPETPDTPTDTGKAVLNVGAGKTVDYKANVTIVATATGVPSGYCVALYDGGTLLAKGDNASVTYNVGNMTANRTFTAKIIDANGTVQKDGSGAELSKNVEVKVKTGFFAKLAAFFRTIFGLLPKITIQP